MGTLVPGSVEPESQGWDIHSFFVWGPHCAPCGILVPWPGIEPVPLSWTLDCQRIPLLLVFKILPKVIVMCRRCWEPQALRMAMIWIVRKVRPSSGEGAPEKRSPGTTIPPGWQTQFLLGEELHIHVTKGIWMNHYIGPKLILEKWLERC